MRVPFHRPDPAGRTFHDHIKQRHDLPHPNFHVQENVLSFHNVPLMDLIAQYGTPLKLTHLPTISNQIKSMERLFAEAIRAHRYRGGYTYCYCTKTSQFRFILDEVLKNSNVHLETSSAFDIPLIRSLHRNCKITKDILIVCNGFKPRNYISAINDLIADNFNVLPILDSLDEIHSYTPPTTHPLSIGIRMATTECPKSPFPTSRLGIPSSAILPFYTSTIAPNPHFRLTTLHFFVSSGIRDTPFYWAELRRFMTTYCALAAVCPTLHTIDIGGGLPIARSLARPRFPVARVIHTLVATISSVCAAHNTPHPHILSEFGSYTVGEASATLFRVLDAKQQDSRTKWYMLDGSLITHVPDTWATDAEFVVLPVNGWERAARSAVLGGLTCDGGDWYAGVEKKGVVLPDVFGESAGEHEDAVDQGLSPKETDLYIGFFHTGAYQEALAGYGGTSHCLIPAPKHILIHQNEAGKSVSRVWRSEQECGAMLDVLGYAD